MRNHLSALVLLALSFLLSTGLLAQTPEVFTGGIGNAASAIGQPAVTPGSLVSVFGSELAAGLSQADSIPLATSLADVMVFFNDIPAPLLFVSQGQINAQLPWEVGIGFANIVVMRNGVRSTPVQFPVGASTPGIFTFPSGGIGQAIVINADGTLAQATGSIPGFSTHPAPVGSSVFLLGTGFGAVTPAAVTGNNTVDELRVNSTPPTVLLGGVAARTDFSGLAPEFVGVNQLNFTILQGSPTGDAVEIRLQVGDVVSPAGATMAISAQ